ncbi:hypothetical protein TrVE_jg1490 [Triparma verrucosa]|uniref:Uncharacterized protein n=1 Tax=Triparma verrucosa TaxID=1606542 RepID=A0A9W7BTV9_9STRA|nr:hypothetical protein TrVE_jg1490 [Triparma verrucosa]
MICKYKEVNTAKSRCTPRGDQQKYNDGTPETAGLPVRPVTLTSSKPHDLIHSKITAFGFSVLSVVDCLYQKEEPDGSTRHLLLFTDDLLGHNSNGDYAIIKKHYAELRKDLTATEPTDLNHKKFLNISFHQNDTDGSWHASQNHYVDEMKVKFPKHSQTKNHPGAPETPTEHLYYLFQDVVSPGSPVPLPDGCQLSDSGYLEVYGNSDSEHGGMSNGKAILCCTVFLGSSILINRTIIPKTTAVDTTLAEAQAAFYGTRELQNCRQILETLGLYAHDRLNPPTSHIDNSALVTILLNARKTAVPYAKTHIAIKVAAISNALKNRDIRVEHKRSHQMVSDLGTKILAAAPNAIHSCVMQNVPQSDYLCFWRHIQKFRNRLENPKNLKQPN